MDGIYELEMKAGPEPGRRYPISRFGTRLGRSSSNDIHWPEGELSRNHCLFEPDGDGVCVIDLASANGTYVNGEQVEGRRLLKPGDEISAGPLVFVCRKVVPGETSAQTAVPGSAAKQTGADGRVDLGFGGETSAPSGNAPEGAPSGGGRPEGSARSRAMFAAAALLAAAAAAVLFFPAGSRERPSPPPEAAAGEVASRPSIVSLLCERVEADSSHIYRFSIKLDETGNLYGSFDDVPGENRHIDKKTALSNSARNEIERIFDLPGWAGLEPVYSGPDPASLNKLQSFRIRLVRSDGMKDVRVENTLEPAAFREIRERIETLAGNELGMQTFRLSRAELEESSRRSEELGDAKWEERDVEYGNLAECIRHYTLAKNALETLKSGIDAVARLQMKTERAKSELAKRCHAVRYEAERAIQIRDWERARIELRKLLEMAPEKGDDINREAAKKLVYVEDQIASLRKKGKSGGGKGGKTKGAFGL